MKVNRFNRSFVFMISFLMLGILLITFMLLTDGKDSPDVKTLVDYEAPEQVIFMSSWAGQDTKAILIKELLEKFQNLYPNVDVIDNSVGGEDFLMSLKIDFLSGNDPDVFGLWPGSDIRTLIDKNKVKAMTEILKEDPRWLNSFGEEGFHYVSHEEEIYGLPFEIIYEGLFINRDILEKLNLEIPSTYEDLKNLIIPLRDAGYIPIAYNDTPEGSFLYQNMVMSLAGKEGVENPYHSNGSLHEAFGKALYYMKELYELGAFPLNAFSLTDHERNQLFVEKKAAMIVQGSWFIGGDYIDPNDSNISIVNFPTFSESLANPTDIIYGLGNGVYYLSRSAYDKEETRDESIALLKALTSQETALRVINEMGGMVNIKVPEESIHAP
ncbi:MAG: carbohydrate ABC transporter substrate-binding protein, partial [Vallitaleaceae bacterium]|nr:carbohydrate ABC transporter substrate-binding protein [Vallitaleaceae bacterium]